MKATKSGRAASSTERRTTTSEAYERVYGLMAREKPESYPEWWGHPEKLPRRPPGGGKGQA